MFFVVPRQNFKYCALSHLFLGSFEARSRLYMPSSSSGKQEGVKTFGEEDVLCFLSQFNVCID